MPVSMRRKRFTGAEVGARFAVNANRLNANVRRARLEVSVDTFANPRLAAPCDDRVDQPIAAAVLELSVLPAKCPKVIRIIRQTGDEIAHEPARGRPSFRDVGVDHPGLL